MDTRYRRASYLDAVITSTPIQLDLVEEMEWEDHVEFLTLEEVGLEEDNNYQPIHGGKCENAYTTSGSVLEYCDWFYDGELGDVASR
jgi:hypothetical protein